MRKLGGDNATRLAADAGLARTTRLCDALQDFKKRKAEVHNFMDSINEATTQEQRGRLMVLQMDAVSSEDEPATMLWNLLNLQSTKIQNSLKQLQLIHDRTQCLDEKGTGNSWKHDLSNNSPLQEILHKGRARLKVIKATDTLQKYISSLAQACFIWDSWAVCVGTSTKQNPRPPCLVFSYRDLEVHYLAARPLLMRRSLPT